MYFASTALTPHGILSNSLQHNEKYLASIKENIAYHRSEMEKLQDEWLRVEILVKQIKEAVTVLAPRSSINQCGGCIND